MIETHGKRSILDTHAIVHIPGIHKYTCKYANELRVNVNIHGGRDNELVCLVERISSYLDWKPGEFRSRVYLVSGEGYFSLESTMFCETANAWGLLSGEIVPMPLKLKNSACNWIVQPILKR